MTSSPKKALSFTKVLRLPAQSLKFSLSSACSFFAVLFPFAESNVRNGAHIAIAKDAKLGGFSYVIQEHNLTVTSDESGTPIPQRRPKAV